MFFGVFPILALNNIFVIEKEEIISQGRDTRKEHDGIAHCLKYNGKYERNKTEIPLKLYQAPPGGGGLVNFHVLKEGLIEMELIREGGL